MKPWLFSSLNGVGLALFAFLSRESKADSWATPTDRTYLSENGKLQFFVAVGDTLGSQRKEPSGTLRLKFGEQWEGVRTNRLINRISPVQGRRHPP